MKLTIYKIDGKSSGKKAELDDSIFGIEPNETVMYEGGRGQGHPAQGRDSG